MREQIFVLADGRKLGYAVYGIADGWPVLYFHGTPSSRLELLLLNRYEIDVEQLLIKARIRLIAVDRPGMGLSSSHPRRTLISFSDDVHSLSRALGISHCSVMGWSGGGPYALAIAWRYPALIRDVFILCGFSQQFRSKALRQMGMNKWYFLSAKYTPWLLEFALKKVSRCKAHLALPRWFSRLPDVDHELLTDPENMQVIATTTLKEACKAGPKGPVHDAQLYFNDFGFNLADVTQVVHFWWGSKDVAVSRLHPQAVKEQINNSVLHYKEGEGHLSVYVHCFNEAIQLISSTNYEIPSDLSSPPPT